jgi:hypothetical protein
LVECQLPKLNVASSNLVARSRNFPSPVLTKLAAQVLCQNEDHRFGRHSLRSCAESGLDVAGSIPVSRSKASQVPFRRNLQSKFPVKTRILDSANTRYARAPNRDRTLFREARSPAQKMIWESEHSELAYRVNNPVENRIFQPPKQRTTIPECLPGSKHTDRLLTQEPMKAKVCSPPKSGCITISVSTTILMEEP